MPDGRLGDSTETFDRLRKLLALVIASFPVLMPLFEQFTEDVTGGLHRIADALPEITEALSHIPQETGTSDELIRQLMEIPPELTTFFRATDN